MWVVVKLIIGGIWSRMVALAQWFIERPIRIVIGLIIVAFVMLIAANHTLQRENATLVERVAEQQKLYSDTITAYDAAAIEAQRIADESKRRVEAQWRQQLEQANDLAQTRLADYRRRIADVVRRNAAAASSNGITGNADMPGVAALPVRSVPDAADPLVPVPVTDLDACATAFARLEGLIAFVQGVAAVDPAPESQP